MKLNQDGGIKIERGITWNGLWRLSRRHDKIDKILWSDGSYGDHGKSIRTSDCKFIVFNKNHYPKPLKK